MGNLYNSEANLLGNEADVAINNFIAGHIFSRIKTETTTTKNNKNNNKKQQQQNKKNNNKKKKKKQNKKKKPKKKTTKNKKQNIHWLTLCGEVYEKTC